MALSGGLEASVGQAVLGNGLQLWSFAKVESSCSVSSLRWQKTRFRNSDLEIESFAVG